MGSAKNNLMTEKRTGNMAPSKIPAKWCINPNQATIYNVKIFKRYKITKDD